VVGDRNNNSSVSISFDNKRKYNISKNKLTIITPISAEVWCGVVWRWQTLHGHGVAWDCQLATVIFQEKDGDENKRCPN